MSDYDGSVSDVWGHRHTVWWVTLGRLVSRWLLWAVVGLLWDKDAYPSSVTVLRQTHFDVIIRQCVMSDRNLAYAVLIRHKTQSDGEVRDCLLP